MYIGGFHLFAGLFFLLLSTLLVFFYLAALFVTVVGLRWLWDKFHQSPKPMVLSRDRLIRSACKGFVYTLIFLSSIYVFQRLKWCGAENAHRQAKEYFVAGQPLAGLRLLLTGHLNPDNPVLQPLHGLQQLIYRQGIKYLPDDDGEIGVWTDLWFNYPYIRKMWEPYGTDMRAPSYRMRELLDRTWFAMEAMSSRPFADKEMEDKNYLLNFPRSAFYYTIKDGYYHDQRIGSSFHLLKDPTFVERSRLLNEWASILRERWFAQGQYETIKRKYPKVEALRQVVVLDTLENLIRSTIYPGQFSCANSDIPSYVEARREFVDENAEHHVLKQLRQKEKRQADNLYAIGIGAVAPAFLKYLLKQYCDMEVLGTMRFGYKNKEAEQRRIKDHVEYTFRYEIKILEEGKHE